METTHYLFDFDGVLVDSMEIWAGTHIAALERAGIPVPADFVETITPLGNYHASRYTISLGLDVSLEDYLDRVSRELLEAYATRVRIKPHVADALARLKGQGIHLHVLTASPHSYVDDCLKRWNVYHLFEQVWTIDDFGLTKGEPEIYRQAAARLGAEVNCCTMLDDNIKANSTAKEAGLNTIAVYDKSSRAAEAAMRATAQRYIYDFSEL